MKRSDIIISNFIIFLTLLVGTIIIGFFSELYDFFNGAKENGLLNVFQIGIFGSMFSFFTYGIIVWPPIIILNILIEILSLKKITSISDFKNSIILEIVIVAILSSYISLTYMYYYWLLLIPIFSFGEYVRLKYLK